jgi:hypothetical protein
VTHPGKIYDIRIEFRNCGPPTKRMDCLGNNKDRVVTEWCSRQSMKYVVTISRYTRQASVTVLEAPRLFYRQLHQVILHRGKVIPTKKEVTTGTDDPRKQYWEKVSQYEGMSNIFHPC